MPSPGKLLGSERKNLAAQTDFKFQEYYLSLEGIVGSIKNARSFLNSSTH